MPISFVKSGPIAHEPLRGSQIAWGSEPVYCRNGCAVPLEDHGFVAFLNRLDEFGKAGLGLMHVDSNHGKLT